jgi:hypothetical protein
MRLISEEISQMVKDKKSKNKIWLYGASRICPIILRPKSKKQRILWKRECKRTYKKTIKVLTHCVWAMASPCPNRVMRQILFALAKFKEFGHIPKEHDWVQISIHNRKHNNAYCFLAKPRNPGNIPEVTQKVTTDNMLSK